MKMPLIRKYSYLLAIILLQIPLPGIKANDIESVPSSCSQIVLVLTDSVRASKGMLYCLERDKAETEWVLLSSSTVPVAIGSNGLGCGRGLQMAEVLKDLPEKREGDGRSPAGMFLLSSVFGYNVPDEMTDLRMPYIHVTEMIECIDDENSRVYNRIVSKDETGITDHIDWQSSEKMSRAGIYYELVVVVGHNDKKHQTTIT